MPFVTSAVSASKPLARPAFPTIPRAVKKPKRAKKFKEKPVDLISHEGIRLTDINEFLKSQDLDPESTLNDMNMVLNLAKGEPNPNHKVVRIKIEAISSVGDGLALYRGEDCQRAPRVVVVPFTLPGDVVDAKIYMTHYRYFESELVSVVEPSPDRDDSLVRCRYFTKCSGCQYQEVPYAKQLELKRNVVVNAYKHFASKLDKQLIPEVLPTVASPLEYNYRTKLTPHFDVPRGGLKTGPTIGFNQKGRRTVLDIEECIIGTETLRPALTQERTRILDSFSTFKKGATLLLRESSIDDNPAERICVTSTKETIVEQVGEFKFHYPASAFFQNNNSILPAVTSYVRDNIVLPSTGKPPRYLVDTYCGSGLFAITCSPAVEKVIGVEISKDSVGYAEKNAQLNNLANASFIVGEAQKIFEKVDTPPEETSIIVDPPRKGCDHQFLDQLLQFKPAKVVYVSCNVHSQARDIEYLLLSERGKDYKIESIRGFDFFPQTHHVESVAVLSRS